MMAPKRASLLACATDAWACLAPADARGDFVARLRRRCLLRCFYRLKISNN